LDEKEYEKYGKECLEAYHADIDKILLKNKKVNKP